MPSCGAEEFCTAPPFVKATNGKINASTVILPTVFQVGLSGLKECMDKTEKLFPSHEWKLLLLNGIYFQFVEN